MKFRLFLLIIATLCISIGSNAKAQNVIASHVPPEIITAADAIKNRAKRQITDNTAILKEGINTAKKADMESCVGSNFSLPNIQIPTLADVKAMACSGASDAIKAGEDLLTDMADDFLADQTNGVIGAVAPNELIAIIPSDTFPDVSRFKDLSPYILGD
jgi:hypothetical protein